MKSLSWPGAKLVVLKATSGKSSKSSAQKLRELKLQLESACTCGWDDQVLGLLLDAADLGEDPALLVTVPSLPEIDPAVLGYCEPQIILSFMVAAVRSGNLEVVQVLLCCGASPNDECLDAACSRLVFDLVELLLECGEGHIKKVPCDVTDPELVEILLDSGLFGPQDLTWAGVSFWNSDDMAETVEPMIQSGMGASTVTRLLIECIRQGHLKLGAADTLLAMQTIDDETAKTLESGIGIKFSSLLSVVYLMNSSDSPDLSPCLEMLSHFCFLACRQGMSACLESLLICGMDPNYGSLRDSPLLEIVAAGSQSVHTSELLLCAGARFDKIDVPGSSGGCPLGFIGLVAHLLTSWPRGSTEADNATQKHARWVLTFLPSTIFSVELLDAVMTLVEVASPESDQEETRDAMVTCLFRRAVDCRVVRALFDMMSDPLSSTELCCDLSSACVLPCLGPAVDVNLEFWHFIYECGGLLPPGTLSRNWQSRALQGRCWHSSSAQDGDQDIPLVDRLCNDTSTVQHWPPAFLAE